jgi:acetamidase/formamidase
LPEFVRKINVDEKWMYWSKRVTLPYKPHIGILSCSPEIDPINSLTPDNHGGNMYLPDMGPGSVTYLPVRTQGGRLLIGDAHGCQGDGEVCDIAVEYATATTIRVDLIKGWHIGWPLLENDEVIIEQEISGNEISCRRRQPDLKRKISAWKCRDITPPIVFCQGDGTAALHWRNHRRKAQHA